MGPKLVGRLAALGIARPEALLSHLPLRYEDRTHITPMGSLRAGESAQVAGEVRTVNLARKGRRMLVVLLADETGFVSLRFFHFNPGIRAAFRRGARYLCYGEVRAGMNGLELVHPHFRAVPRDKPIVVDSRLTPVYPTVAGLSQFQLRRLIKTAFAELSAGRIAAYALDPLQRGWPDVRAALEAIHFPGPEAGPPDTAAPAFARLAFDELLAHHLALRASRAARRSESSLDLSAGTTLTEKLKSALPFALTGAQRRCTGEIARDLAGPHPMRRLLQGDVGSGKTALAALAAAQVIGAGFQAALMAPTELLAEQHLRTLAPWCEEIGIALGLLTASTSASERRQWRARARAGEPLLLVGTHALITEGSTLARLALAIVDEQHRFGVGQRLALAGGETGEVQPHQLVMTATPIPRTLAMTLYADLDVSTLDELPPGRKPVATAVMSEARRAELIARIGRLVAAGQQAYWVCPLIEESELLEAQAAEKTSEALAEALPDVTVGLVHGRLKTKEKDAIMRRFVNGEIGLLVATTVIEVGVDVPNASLMVIENAERLGLAQLHQLRGRVGRGEAESHCLLLYRPPLSSRARERLAALRATTNGFEIAETDLKLRGPGELIGKRQAGLAQLRIADLARDRALLARMAPTAERLLAEAPEEVKALIHFWLGENVHYANA
jgi:ATP-dependent DNA helicase RecG